MFSAYMNDTITIRRMTAGSWGTTTPTDTTAKCRFEFKTKLVRNSAGEQVVASARVLLPVLTLGHQDKIIYLTKTYSIIAIELIKDFSNKGMVVYLA